jgi:hypothetical protein
MSLACVNLLRGGLRRFPPVPSQNLFLYPCIPFTAANPARALTSSAPVDARAISFDINKRIMAVQLRDWKSTLSIYSSDRASFNHVNWATVVSRLGKLSTFVPDRAALNRDPVFRSFLADLAVRMTAHPELRRFGGVREVGNILHGLAKLREPHQKRPHKNIQIIFDAAESDAAWLVQNGNLLTVLNTAWAFATLSVPAPNLFSEIDKRASSLIKTAKPREVSNLAWAFAKARCPAPNLTKEIDNRSAFLVEYGDPRASANLTWALAKLATLTEDANPPENPAPAYFAAIQSHGARLVLKGNSTDVTNIAWAFATLGIEAPAFFSNIEQVLSLGDGRLVDKLAKGNPQNIALIAWAFAKPSTPAPNVFALIDSTAPSLVQRGTIQTISLIAWAAAKLHSPEPALPAFFSVVEEKSVDLVTAAANTGKTQELSNLAWAFSELHYYAPTYAAALDDSSASLIASSLSRNVRAIPTIALFFAKMGIQPALFFRCLADSVEEFELASSDEGAGFVVDVCWSIAILDAGKEHERLLVRLWEWLLRVESDGVISFTPADLVRLIEIELVTGLSGVKLEAMQQTMRRRAEEAVWEQMMSLSREGDDRYEDDCSELLTGVGFEHERNESPVVSDVGSLFAIDMACTKSKIAVEADGPSRFLTSLTKADAKAGGASGFRESGTTQAKCRVLERLGWQVVKLQHFELDEVRERPGIDGWKKSMFVIEAFEKIGRPIMTPGARARLEQVWAAREKARSDE